MKSLIRKAALICSLALVEATQEASCASQRDQRQYVKSEVEYLASLGPRLTGSSQHNALIDHIYMELNCLGFEVHTSTWTFPYFDGPRSSPQLSVDELAVPVSSYGARLGKTNSTGVTGQLVNLWTSSLDEVPDWKRAKGKIAVTNITNFANERQSYISTWPDSPKWFSDFGSPELTTATVITSLTDAADEGVKGVIYVWQNVTGGLVNGQFTPFRELYTGVPTLFTQGEDVERMLLQGAKNGSETTMTINASIIPQWPIRTLWIVVEGTDLKNESVIINTHTDGVNVVEENGHIALLLKAAQLAAKPPRRTTILLFVAGHMQKQSFSADPGQATTRWLDENPQLWAGAGNRHDIANGGQMKAVVGSCVEHLGAIRWVEDLENDTYSASDGLEPELLYASTSQLNDLLRQHWSGAQPNVTRISDPDLSSGRQLGEGMAFLLTDIPNFSLATVPSYLLKIWPERFDEAQLIDQDAMFRQVDSFMQMWSLLDDMPANSIEPVEQIA